MTQAPANGDKNLLNVADKLEQEGVNAQQAQQLNQDINDRRKDAKETDTPKTPGNP
ncbi:hypothetical protein [Xylanibacillus composti]|uniref:Uncharacterized protein n=1 Tax=Xylanibacillus composti TaxID=1572762 RepID=A0A8J4H8T4_9BACL|nr:hypothetical protein [Xylanibacillus composti]GIQ70833.1 hypothetical protein XYCOK13_36570 [Xylanibacillus composti]